MTLTQKKGSLILGSSGLILLLSTLFFNPQKQFTSLVLKHVTDDLGQSYLL